MGISEDTGRLLKAREWFIWLAAIRESSNDRGMDLHWA
jgi:hypothetical protein